MGKHKFLNSKHIKGDVAGIFEAIEKSAKVDEIPIICFVKITGISLYTMEGLRSGATRRLSFTSVVLLLQFLDSIDFPWREYIWVSPEVETFIYSMRPAIENHDFPANYEVDTEWENKYYQDDRPEFFREDVDNGRRAPETSWWKDFCLTYA